MSAKSDYQFEKIKYYEDEIPCVVTWMLDYFHTPENIKRSDIEKKLHGGKNIKFDWAEGYVFSQEERAEKLI